MRISISKGRKKLFIPIPTFLLFNPITLSIIRHSTADNKEVDHSRLSAKQIRQIRRCIRKMRRIHENLYLVEVDDGDSSVRIRL